MLQDPPPARPDGSLPDPPPARPPAGGFPPDPPPVRATGAGLPPNPVRARRPAGSPSPRRVPGRNVPAVRDLPPVLDPLAEPVPESHQLPPHQNKLERITQHVAALSGDLREYVEIRIALVQRRIEGVVGILERFKMYADAAKFFVPAALAAIVGLLFLLVTLALAIGALIGSYWGGFAIMTLILLIAAGVSGWLGMKKVREAQAIQAEIKREQRNARQATREQVEEAERVTARRSSV